MRHTFEYDDAPVVQTGSGKLKGYIFDGIHIFKGVPYAEAERFQMPKPVPAWEGVREATSYGFVCPLMQQETPSGELLVPHRYWPQSEHCQNLNIWTPAPDATAKKPVMVWFHGGGYTAGSAIEQEAYDGATMSRLGDVVVVTVNHRLNILGYLDLSPFGEKYANSANAGHADLVAALQWVRDNIAAFGGDPGNVTIFGQSGGGMKVSAMMQIPSAAGLFQRGIIMSGVAGDLMPTGAGDGTQIVRAMLAELGIAENEIDKLETVPYARLAEAHGKVFMPLAQTGAYVGCAPMVNDFYLGEPAGENYTEQAKNTPLMVGNVFGEFAFAPITYNKYQMSDAEMTTLLEEKFGEHTSALVELFRAAYPDKKIIDLLSLDGIFRQQTKKLIQEKAAHSQAPTYSYLFAFEFPIQRGKPAWHCSDIPFVFHNTHKVEVCSVPGVADKLEEQIFAAVMAFARTGNPNCPELPHWPASKPGEEATMVFDRTCEVRTNFDNALLAKHVEASPPLSLMAMMAEATIQH